MIPRTTPTPSDLVKVSQQTGFSPDAAELILRTLRAAGFVTMRLDEFEFEARLAAQYEGFKMAVEVMTSARSDDRPRATAIVTAHREWVEAREACVTAHIATPEMSSRLANAEAALLEVAR